MQEVHFGGREGHWDKGKAYGDGKREGDNRNSFFSQKTEPHTTTPRCCPGLVVVWQSRLWPCS